MTKQNYALVLLTGSMIFLSVLSASAISVKGRAWNDPNSNGIQEPGESGMANVLVTLELNGVDIVSQYTNGIGRYVFSDVLPGNYRVKFLVPAPLWASAPNSGADESLDSDIDYLGNTDYFLVMPGPGPDVILDAGFAPVAYACFTPLQVLVDSFLCSDNNTPDNTTDDTFTFQLTTAGGAAAGWDLPALVSAAAYGQPFALGPFAISGGALDFQVSDHANPLCTAGFSVDPAVGCAATLNAACDVKETPCVKFELIHVKKDPAENKTYRIRVTNTCSEKLTYVAFQIPDGVVAMSPANNDLYGSAEYLVKSPNYTPFYSIRFSAPVNGLVNGASDTFEYTLPAQADPLYIHVLARLQPQTFFEAHLNTFDCLDQSSSNAVQPSGKQAILDASEKK